jgi:predicted GIY-YIG superfamily endonuclease
MGNNKRDTVTYDLKVGSNIVYRGTTNNPERREQEHRDQGKSFGHLTVTSRKMTEDGAMKKEENNLKTFRSNHNGRNPKYNKDSDG